MSEETTPKKKKATIGGFFGVDIDGVNKACELGINPAVAYLVLACFSDETNRYTPASVQAIEKYTGISRKYATKALDALTSAKLIGLLPSDSTRPRYEIFGAPPAPPPPRAFGYRCDKLAREEQVAFQCVESGKAFLNGHALAAARRAVTKGWLVENDGVFAVREAPPPPAPVERTMVWLPNELIKGIGGTAPIERVRQTSNPLVLRMLVELYSKQSLKSDGGIEREALYEPYKSECIGRIHEYNVWLFAKGKNRHCTSEMADRYASKDESRGAWNRIQALEALGLIQWCLQLFDAPEGGLLHPLGPVDGRDLDSVTQTSALHVEREIGIAALKAGRALARELHNQGKLLRALSDDEWLIAWIIPIPQHIAKPTMFGVARLRYRPKTSDTTKWYGELMGNREAWLAGFNGLYQRTLSPSEIAANW